LSAPVVFVAALALSVLGATFAGAVLAEPIVADQRARTLHDPDAVVSVGRDAGDPAEDPVIRQRLRPEMDRSGMVLGLERVRRPTIPAAQRLCLGFVPREFP
jgi:hypothetical protein